MNRFIRTKQQELKALRRKAITSQNKATTKKTMTEAMREVKNVSHDV
jgi:hypothetical protein